MAGPILLTLAVEIALKAWQCRERNGAPDHCHDLLKLFEGLRPETQNQLEKLFPEEPDPLNAHDVWPVGAGMRKTLEYHRDAFGLWRYLHEVDLGARFFTNSLDAALTVIIEAFDPGLVD
ncbi:MAG: hypothetical protein F4X40_07310 [Chloroflexi bacterium]|nr:hypothetical protein [Chloroflexota bacterium]